MFPLLIRNYIVNTIFHLYNLYYEIIHLNLLNKYYREWMLYVKLTIPHFCQLIKNE